MGISESTEWGFGSHCLPVYSSNLCKNILINRGTTAPLQSGSVATTNNAPSPGARVHRGRGAPRLICTRDKTLFDCPNPAPITHTFCDALAARYLCHTHGPLIRRTEAVLSPISGRVFHLGWINYVERKKKRKKKSGFRELLCGWQKPETHEWQERWVTALQLRRFIPLGPSGQFIDEALMEYSSRDYHKHKD